MKNTMKKIEQVRWAFENELKVVFKDRGAILILLIAVWIYPLVYSIAYQKNVVRNIPMTVVDCDKSALSRQLIRMIGATQEIKVQEVSDNFKEAVSIFRDGDSKGIIQIPAEFERKILKGDQANIGLYCDAGYFLIYKESLRGTLKATGTLSAGIEIKRLMAAGIMPEVAGMQRDPVTMKSYSLYNPEGSYGSYVMPGLILVVLQQTLLVGIGMLCGGRREKEKWIASGKDNSLKTIFFTLTGKSLVYFLLYAFNLIFTQIILFDWFGLPNQGSLLDVWILMIPFLFSVIFLGFTVSLLMRRREHSIMMLVFFSPVVFFVSGMSWPSSSLPPLLSQLSLILPSTSVIPAFLRIRTMGGTLTDVRHELFFLIVQMVLYGLIAMFSYKMLLRSLGGVRGGQNDKE
jgi:ABC-2 type transport system permease protein